MLASFRPIHPQRKVFAFWFVFFAFMFSGSPAWALPADNVQVTSFHYYDHFVGGFNITYGNLYFDDSYTDLGGGFGGNITDYGYTSAELTPVSDQYLMLESDWILLNDSNGGNNLVNFLRSTATYTVKGDVYVIVTTKTPDPNAPDTKPLLNHPAAEVDAEVDLMISIPLSVRDDEQDAFTILGGPKGSSLSTVYDLNGLPTIDLQWTPTLKDVNKVIKVTLKAKETKHKKLTSNSVNTKIRIWPAGGQSDASSISKFSVTTASWHADVLTLAGKVVPNKILNAAERTAFLAKQLDLTLTQGSTGTGNPVGTPIPLTLKANGNWKVSMPLPAAEVPCKLSFQYDGHPAMHTVGRAPKGCLK